VKPVKPARKATEDRVKCRRCGQLIRRQRECPRCDAEPGGVLPVEPDEKPKDVLGLAPHSMELDGPGPLSLASEQEEDESPYQISGQMPTCPKCKKDMEKGAVICLSCGFDLRKRKKVARSYEPIARSWETEMPLKTRLMWMAAFQAFHAFLTIGALLGGFGWAFFIAWFPFTGLLCFILGTYDKTELTRDARGRATMIKSWRFCFVPLMPEKTEIRGFQGVVSGQYNNAGIWEWLVFGSLFCMGLIPAIIWWFNVIHRSQYYVALARDHGHAEVYVYRGRNDEQAVEIGKVLREASGLRDIS
jgi:hypothetical protein